MNNDATFVQGIKYPDHFHKFMEPECFGFGSILTTLACYDEDCSKGLDTQDFPPEKIGPKLVLRDQK